MAGVTPLPDGGKRAGGRPPRARRKATPRPAPPAPLKIERWGEQVEAMAAGFDRRELARLRRGEIPVEASLDLHGHSAEDARRQMIALFERAAREGYRCLLVVHGRGHRSPAGPVIKASIPGWLAAPPWGSEVRAFVTAPPSLGGPGATLVLLRRRRPATAQPTLPRRDER